MFNLHARSAARLSCGAVASSVLATLAPCGAATAYGVPVPAALYRYEGVVYDRLFSVFQKARFAPPAATRDATFERPSALPGTPYAITDLETVFTGRDGPLTGFPLGINNAGRIAFYDTCACFGDGNEAGIVTDDRGKEIADLLGPCCTAASYSIPYAINDAGYTTGQFYFMNAAGVPFSGNITWSPNGSTLYYGGAHNGSATVAINASNISAGVSEGPKGTFAGAYVPTSTGMRRFLLANPETEATWLGFATGIDAAGEIVGFTLNATTGQGRAVRFFENGPAQILPVAARGVSASAQAINVHGDIVGNAGRQAFLYKNNRVTYLPRPPGENAGNAVAYAINAHDEIVGDIVDGNRQTAFLYVNGRSYDLVSLLPPRSVAGIASATGINDSGEIVGTAYNIYYFGFSMKPRPTR